MKIKKNNKIIPKKYKEIGKNYKKARLAIGLKQEKVAEYLDLAPSYISDLENRKIIRQY